MKGNIRPTAVYKIETPIQETYDIKNNIQDIINTSANSGIRTLDITQQNVQVPTHQIYDTPLHADVLTNKARPGTQIIDNNMNTNRYLQTPNYNVVNSNTSSNTTSFMSIDEVLDLPEMPIQNIHVIEHNAPYSRGGDGTKYIHKDVERNRELPSYSSSTNMADNTKYKRHLHENTIELERNIPSGQMYTNMTQRGEYNNSSRTANLIPKINAGEFSIPASKPLENHIQEIPILRETDKQRMSRMVMDSQSRYAVPSPKR